MGRRVGIEAEDEMGVRVVVQMGAGAMVQAVGK